MAGTVTDQEWLHQGNQLAAIRRFFVRFDGRYMRYVNYMCHR
jgi:hypothetical protein